MLTLYGIKNCDTVKKARNWLEQNGVNYRFHDFRVDGIDEKQIRQWSKTVGWETLLNKRGTTFRQLPDSDKNGLTESKAVKLMAAHPTLIKRPVIEKAGIIKTVGFDQKQFGVFK
ncbi:MAG TPA: ArsC family reductase [Gammaproteobacteria bacterium]|jgi:Spx/MgsR family transcriptional regulator